MQFAFAVDGIKGSNAYIYRPVSEVGVDINFLINPAGIVRVNPGLGEIIKKRKIDGCQLSHMIFLVPGSDCSLSYSALMTGFSYKPVITSWAKEFSRIPASNDDKEDDFLHYSSRSSSEFSIVSIGWSRNDCCIRII